MVEQTYNAVNKYFNNLCNTGYMSQTEVNKLMAFVIIQELIDNDFRGFITEQDYNYIGKALYCLYGSNCLIPYPDYYSGKNKRIMYTGSISELTHRIEKAEETLEVFNNFLDEDIVIPGDEVKEVTDEDISPYSDNE